MVHTYLVECYWPDATPGAFADRAARAIDSAHRLRAQGHAVDVLGCTIVPADEVAFWRFAGDSLNTVKTVGSLAGLAYHRISESVELGADGAQYDIEGDQQ